jgi:transglycosylase-like protein with SLT domain
MSSGFRAGAGAVLAFCVSLSGVYAAEPYKDFTFKRVKPPASGAKRLITIQIAPSGGSNPAPEGLIKPAAGATTLNTWFWDEIEPQLSAAGPGRFNAATRVLALAPADQPVVTPRLEIFRTLASQHGTDILLATLNTRVSPALVLAMIGAKGGQDTNSGETQGLMPLTADTARRFDVDDRLDEKQSIKGGVAYLSYLLKKFDSDPILALAAYNAGEAAIEEFEGVPPFATTRSYVPNVVAAFQVTRVLCQTPPELYSDGCVFALKDPTE